MIRRAPLWLVYLALPLALAQQFPFSASATDSIISLDSGGISSVSEPQPATQPRKTIPIKPYTFTPFPVPSQSSIPGLFPETDPSNPPSVGAAVIPNFEPSWIAAYEKAKEKISGLTLEEKVSLTTGLGYHVGRCVGNIPAIDHVGWPGLCLQDSPLGVRLADYVTVFPAGINTAATWNRDLMRARGIAMGEEHRGKGVHVALGPGMNLFRVPQGGRNWEGFGADPFLTGEAAYETILGMQQTGVQACAKHIIFNEQEHKRTMSSSNVDDRTTHEVYAHPFLRSVQAGVASLMCSYNLINGTYACENDRILNDILKREYAFQGYVMSDWRATMSTISAITGLDMTMPGGITLESGTGSYFGGNLTAYVQNGTIPEARVDDMATRIVAAWYLLSQDSDDYPPVNFDSYDPFNLETNEHIDVQNDHADLVRRIGAASTILLKNTDGALPLAGKERSVFLAGSDAGPAKIGPNRYANHHGLADGPLAVGWGSGTANFTYLISPYDAILPRARKHRTSLSWTFDDYDLATAGNMAYDRDVALVFIAADSGETTPTLADRECVSDHSMNLTAWHGGEDLILAVAAQNNNTIVVVNSVGPLIVESWIDHPNVTAVLWAGLQGNEAGNAIADVLYGDVNPSGRLPYTIAKRLEDYPAQLVLGGEPDDIISIPYSEGLEIDYRHFDAHNIEPRFEFGFGLSYTDWDYSDLSIATVESTGNHSDLEDAWAQGKPTPIEFGSSVAIWLHKPVFNVTFNVHNTGGRAGTEIVQLYLNMPNSVGEPPSILKGFNHVEVLPGETKTVSILLSRYDVSIWDAGAQGWRKPDGEIGVTVGRSSRDGKLVGKLPA
ncbi:glycoside hydrolase family 3 protein [Moniliophthora roreri MCA 2997]|uniref:beta-glucosidase n=1 Tax=Moniliophthora roreri (strain MCA 2997) TaxID=1381753 RepID=V2XRV8_MONRO|nr:glycoside hydrolase family 3 protein [Moniliophthora roreri MCA 2997]